MNEKKLIEAFSKIKRDMNYLSSEIGKIKKVNELSSEIKTQIEEIKKFNLDRFTKNQELELKNLNKFIANFDKKIAKTESKNIKFENLVKGYSNEVEDLKLKLNEANNKAENNHLDIDVFNERMAEFQELMNEKISMEIAGLRMEFASGIDNVKVINDVKAKKNLFNSKPKEKVEKKPSNKIEMVIPEMDGEEKKDSKFKKVVKWLFVDEVENNEMDSIKSEVEKSSKKK